MEKLAMCRICLVQNVRMYLVGNRNFHEIYEKLTDIPFITEDRRPILVCFFCCAKLEKCCQLMRKCLEAEKLFAQMMNENYEPNPLINQDHLEYLGGFIKSPIENISIVDGVQTESIAIKEELPAVCEGLDDIIKPKEEHQSDELELENLDNSCLDVADIPPHHSEFDLEEDVPLMEFKTQVDEEQELSEKKQRARETKRATVARKPKLDTRRTKLENAITAKQTKKEKSDLKVIRTTHPDMVSCNVGWGEDVPEDFESLLRNSNSEDEGPEEEFLELFEPEEQEEVVGEYEEPDLEYVDSPPTLLGLNTQEGEKIPLDLPQSPPMARSSSPVMPSPPRAPVSPTLVENAEDGSQLLNIRNVDLPAGRGLEKSLHPSRKRQWQPSDPAPRPSPPPPQMEVEVLLEDFPPSPSPPVRESSPSLAEPTPPSPSYSVSSPAYNTECVSIGRPFPRQSLRDDDIFNQLCYGSEPDSSESEDEDLAPIFGIPRAQRSAWETPVDPDEDDDDTEDDPAAAVPADSMNVPPTATDQPRSLYDFVWNGFPNVPIPESRRESFSHTNVGPTAPCVDPYDIFVSIWDRQFMEYIAAESNRYAQQVAAQLLETNNLHPHSRISRWQDTTADELYVYFGIVLAMGVVVKSRMEEYWSVTPDVFYTPGFSAHMSSNRFIILSKCIHFVNNEHMCALELDTSEAKLFKIQPLLSHLNNKFQSLYRPGQNIALDESLLQWKGWLDISQLIPNKAASMGIKTYEICESQTGYLWRFEVHALGKSRRPPPQQFEDPMKASTPAIVLRLTNGLEGKGHTLWMDNFYNSPCLARRLKTLGFDCVGTLRTNRKLVPQALHSLTKENMRKDQITGLTSGDVDVMVWRDNNRVAMISTYHGNAVSQIRGSTKPILIHDYNIMMGGVDKKDKMLAMYPIERKRTKVWYKKLFRRLLNVSTLNA